MLPFFSPTWKEKSWLSGYNTKQLPLSVGAFAGVRIDMGPQFTGTPLLVPATEPAAGNTALSKSALLPFSKSTQGTSP